MAAAAAAYVEFYVASTLGLTARLRASMFCDVRSCRANGFYKRPSASNSSGNSQSLHGDCDANTDVDADAIASLRNFGSPRRLHRRHRRRRGRRGSLWVLFVITHIILSLRLRLRRRRRSAALDAAACNELCMCVCVSVSVCVSAVHFSTTTCNITGQHAAFLVSAQILKA